MELILTILTLFIIIELITAFIIYPLKTGKNYYRLIAEENFIFRFDPIIGYSYKSNFIYQNPFAPISTAPRRFLYRDFQTGKEGFFFKEDILLLKERLIFCIGGSTTVGAECRYDNTYPAILDSLVKSCGYRCINAGIGGYRSIHELLLFKYKILRYKPSVVIIFSGYNDFEESTYDFYEPYNQFRHCVSHFLPASRLEKIFFYNSAFFHMLKRLRYKLSGNIRVETTTIPLRKRLEDALTRDVWLKVWKDNIGKIVDLCRENNIKCYLLGHVSPAYKNAPQEAKDLADKDLNMCGRFDIFVEYTKLINNVAADLCREKGAFFIDVASEFNPLDYKKRFSFFVDRMHFSEDGNLLLASSIYKKIKEDL